MQNTCIACPWKAAEADGCLCVTQGHFQIFFSKHSPILQTRLSWFMRIMYMSGVWSYVVGALATPLFIALPIVTVFFGVFPIVISKWAALGLTVYFVCTNAVLYYVRRWAASLSCHACSLDCCSARAELHL